MPCYGPLKGYYSAEVGKSGKRAIVFDHKKSLTGISFDVPCGQCQECRLEKSRQWAIRCMHEKAMHPGCDSSFLTLTYDEDHLPMAGNSPTLRKRDLQLFMKRLRKKRGNGVRFYACGEYGDVSGRPHYHVLLFNVGFLDKKVWSGGRRPDGKQLWTSRELGELWRLGNCLIGDVTFESCAYVARYVMKKITGDAAEFWYGSTEPEFTVMSRRPGIAAGFYEKYGKQVYSTDSVVMRGKRMRPPRFYDLRQEAVDPEGLAVLKRARRAAAREHADDNCSRRRRVKEIVQSAQLRLAKREL